ncbi:MAG TPA: PAS domain S-box protein [Verrucomicrobiae bacterium]|nr:PAS domain S-box protein [Verrucomicrobiae bacterium]
MQIRLADFAGDDAVNLKERLTHLGAAGVCIRETEFVSRNGNRIPVSEQIMAHSRDGEALAYISIVARDITERRRAELELAKTHQELVEASRQAGKAELATALLHNVGNVLTSINVASDCMTASLRKSSMDKLSKVVALLHQHQSDLGLFLCSDPKGQQIPGYLAQLDERLLKERQEVLAELARLQRGVQHIIETRTIGWHYGHNSAWI